MAAIPILMFVFAAFMPDVVQVQKVDDELTVEFRQQKMDLQTGRTVFSGGVKATYGVTEIYSDRLELTLGEGESRGLAEGNIRLMDPDGTMTADKLQFDWRNGVGEAANVVIKSYRVTIRAKTLRIRPGNWTFSEVSATSCDQKVPVYLIQALRIDVEPGKRAIVRQVELKVLGSRLVKIPYFRRSLDNRVSEFALPRLNFDEEGKASATMANSYFVGCNTVIGGFVKMSDGLYPKYGLSATRSFTNTQSLSSSLLPEPEQTASSKHSFFDSVTVTSPLAEKAYLAKPRNALTLGTYWNQRTPGRRVNQTINKPWEMIYQLGGSDGGFDALAQLRLQSIEHIGEGTHERGSASATVSFPSLPLGAGLMSYAKVSGMAYLNPGGQYSWAQSQIGLIWSPLKDVSCGAAYSALEEYGKPLLQSDRPYTKSSFNLRLQWGFGPTKFGFLTKYDFSQKRWYDDEFSLSQIAGCLEPYVVWRRFPRELSFGIGLRMDELLDKLSSRHPLKRT